MSNGQVGHKDVLKQGGTFTVFHVRQGALKFLKIQTYGNLLIGANQVANSRAEPYQTLPQCARTADEISYCINAKCSDRGNQERYGERVE